MPQNVLIEGIGAIGGVVAAKLVAAGYEPTLITGRSATADIINDQGVTLRTPDGEQRYRARAFASLDDLPSHERFDVAMLFMKATDVARAATGTVAHLSPAGFVVPFQNGVVQPLVVEIVGRERVVGALLNWAATMHGPGVYEQTVHAATVIGELDGHSTSRLAELERLVSTFSRAIVTSNITGAIWSKLALNCAFSTVATVVGVTISEALRLPPARQLSLEVYREVIDTAEACGVRPEKMVLDPYSLYLPHDADEQRRRAVDVALIEADRIYGPSKPSILQSLERGKLTEIDFITGHVASAAERAGRSAPANRLLTTMIHEMEQGRRSVGPANLQAYFQSLP